MLGKTILLIFIAILLQGCQNNEINELKTDLQKMETGLKDADRRIENLKSRNNNLKQNLEKANFESENLKIQKTETEEWIEYVIKGIGPCVWAGGQFEKPVPREIVGHGTPNDLIAKLNKIFENTNSPEATLLKVEDGTAYIKVFEDEKLTQGMGTSGAANYINSIVYTLLSIEAIRCVDLDFEEGDHAFPGRECLEKRF